MCFIFCSFNIIFCSVSWCVPLSFSILFLFYHYLRPSLYKARKTGGFVCVFVRDTSSWRWGFLNRLFIQTVFFFAKLQLLSGIARNFLHSIPRFARCSSGSVKKQTCVVRRERERERRKEIGLERSQREREIETSGRERERKREARYQPRRASRKRPSCEERRGSGRMNTGEGRGLV